MSLYPCRHELRPYDPNADPTIVPWMFIAHVAVADRPGIDSGPSFHSGLEWHFYIDKGPGTPQEIVTQLRDTAYQADSSYMANGFWKDGKFCGAISFESEGTGEDEWTPSQLDAIIWLFRQANSIDGIPLVVCPAWNERGLGYHRLFAEWNSPYHSCPGDPKVWQFYNVIIPGLSYIEPEPELPEKVEEFPVPFLFVKTGFSAYVDFSSGTFLDNCPQLDPPIAIISVGNDPNNLETGIRVQCQQVREAMAGGR